MIDLTSACFQTELSEREGGLCLVPPNDIKDEGMIWRVGGNLYGLKDGRVAKESFKFLGIRTEVRKDGGFQQYQKDYIGKLEQVEIMVKNVKENLDEHGLSILRHGVGRLDWAAQGEGPELCFRVAELGTHFKNGNVGHLGLISKSIRDVQNEDVAVQCPRLRGELVIVGFCDAALHNMDDSVIWRRIRDISR